MKNARKFKLNGKIYTTITAMAQELGKKRIYHKDFEKLGIEELTADSEDLFAADVAEETQAEETQAEDNTKDLSAVDLLAERKKFNAKLKGFSLAELVKAAEEAHVKTWGSINHEAIRKMRLIMELKEHFYPVPEGMALPTSSKKSEKSEWSKVQLEDLFKIASSHGITIKESSNPGIQRMRLTMALKKAGITAEQVQKA